MIPENSTSVKNMIQVSGFGSFEPEIWARMTNWAVGIILDTVDGNRLPDSHAMQAKRWLHANNIKSLDQVCSIAGTVRCRFCHHPLSAAKSKVLGYGESCARDNGFPY